MSASLAPTGRLAWHRVASRWPAFQREGTDVDLDDAGFAAICQHDGKAFEACDETREQSTYGRHGQAEKLCTN
jgi:hypothetical protein